MIHAGMIGCGAIGTTLAGAIQDGKAGDVHLDVVYDVLPESASQLVVKFNAEKPHIAANIGEFLDHRGITLVIEAAGQQVAKEMVPMALKAGKNVMLMSVGALADPALLDEIYRTASAVGLKVYVPSGAITGLDGVKAALIAGIDDAMIVSSKPPEALRGAPFIVENGIELDKVKSRQKIFEGNALEAARGFPQNLNVAISLSLAGIGPSKTKVVLVADPSLKKNVHEITVRGPFGVVTAKTENSALPGNPKTSWLAALSAIRKLRDLSEPISMGT
ncbi:MAG: aspartate dehydrogenase [Thaumarchaeota archaeon]|nr:aspartate dehydrogenase [Nitrososphaerota archaeon]